MIIGFTKKESLFVLFVVVALIGTTMINLSASYRKSRDNSRKNALGDIESRINDFQESVGYFPLSTDEGILVGCNGFRDKKGQWHFQECVWGDNKVNSPFFDPLPLDPYAAQGRTFRYFSNGQTYQLFAALEGKYEDEYNIQIVERSLSCGDVPCNAGRTNGKQDTLYKSLPSPTPVQN